jgi:endoribonuclease Dicer
LVSLNYLNYDFSIQANEQPSADILFQAITRRSVNEGFDMENLEILGDCFLKLTVSMSLYYHHPFADVGQLTLEKTKEISNENLYRLVVENNLKNYLYTDKIIFQGNDSNWLPPGYIVKINDSSKYTHQTVKRKAFADMIEALIGAFLISSNYIITIKFMHWLGLNVIPLDNRDRVMSIPPIVSERLNDEMRRIFYEEGFEEIENRLNYVFKNKGYLISAFTHPSKLKNDVTYSYER